MLKGITKKGFLKNVLVDDEGKVMVKSDSSSGGSEVATTLEAGIFTLGIAAFPKTFQKKLTEISIANYSENATVYIQIDSSDFSRTFSIAGNIAVDLPINKVIDSISFSASEENVQIQYVVKGVE